MHRVEDFLYRLVVGVLVIGISVEFLILSYASYIWLHQRTLDIPLGVAIVVFAAVYTLGTLFVYLTTGEAPEN